jgi:lipopolysaccharide export system ATP-binding protein
MRFLTVENLHQTLGKHHIVQGISLHADLGEVIALLGPNGAGKTTLLKTIIGLHPTPRFNQTENLNKILVQDSVINTWPAYKRVAHGLLYLPQQTSLFQQLTVLENLKLVHEYQESWQLQSFKVFEEQMLMLLEQTNLIETLSKRAFMLSGGQKRKLEVVRSILMSPKIIMLDEPFAGVDPKSIYELKKLFTDMASRGIGIIISDHHVDQLLSIAQRVYVVINGQIVTSGGIKDILEHSYTKESYLGNQFYNEISDRFLGKN